MHLLVASPRVRLVALRQRFIRCRVLAAESSNKESACIRKRFRASACMFCSAATMPLTKGGNNYHENYALRAMPSAAKPPFWTKGKMILCGLVALAIFGAANNSNRPRQSAEQVASVATPSKPTTDKYVRDEYGFLVDKDEPERRARQETSGGRNGRHVWPSLWHTSSRSGERRCRDSRWRWHRTDVSAHLDSRGDETQVWRCQVLRGCGRDHTCRKPITDVRAKYLKLAREHTQRINIVTREKALPYVFVLP